MSREPFEFFGRETNLPKARVILFTAISGLANGIILTLINNAAEAAADADIEVHTRHFWMFLAAFLLYIVTKKYALSQSTIATERISWKLRVRIADKVRKAGLRFIEGYDKVEISTRLDRDINQFSQSAVVLVNALQSGIVVVSSMLYILWLSRVGFLLTLVTLGIAIAIYTVNSDQISQKLLTATEKEVRFFGLLNHVISGFKEVKVNAAKSDDLYDVIGRRARETERIRIDTGLQFVTHVLLSQSMFYVLLGMIVFILPNFSPDQNANIIKITTAILFIIGPLDVLVNSIPMYVKAKVALNNISDLETRLDAAREPLYGAAGVPVRHAALVTDLADFKEIRFDELLFHYRSADGTPLYTSGPHDLTIAKGEILFIVGGNGSGKSTLLKLLIDLYPADAGRLLLDDRPVDPAISAAYRNLFAIIFTDFHLFDRLYGLAGVDESRLQRLIRTMRLENKTRYVDGAFTETSLSTGQRKRLAFICAALEDKPIYIFDEWAADQDVVFRKYFYETLLPDLKARGKTIICVTHDDRFHGLADRVIRMEDGKIT